jgi:ABC-type transport system involved in multi-copper enzyme maturation permease subunit
MNAGIVRKSFRETIALSIVCGAAFTGVLSLLARLFPMFYEEGAGVWFRMKFVKVIVSALLGAEISDQLGPDTLMAFAWVHPLALTLLLVHVITFVTRMPAGEIDRGTADLLLGLPVARWRLYLSESVAWLASGAAVIAFGLLGFSVSIRFAPPEFQPSAARLGIIVVNLLTLYASVGGVTWLCSSLSDRRGRAVAVAFALVFSSFLINFIAQIWEPAKRLTALSVLTYYRPMAILAGDGWPVGDLIVLAAVGGGCWLAGMVVFTRRDVCTV